ncbi:hypothetical protein B0T21DRAFT_410124 [Apiosordaria backusii]|uniref:N-acetyltransferase domain-containing protein n=1 Tax=Apiosordaria backusii TaxID=314023 RepID=A0AA40BT37_9PEZI|nr:hypothetical protein B0T21DRAFT_410124 [Apiosordaria backusii]
MSPPEPSTNYFNLTSPIAFSAVASPGMELTKKRVTTVIQDSHSYLPLSKPLKDGDILLLLTPGIVPDVSTAKVDHEAPTSDPFEPLGKALAKHHPWVRHVPYLPRYGITGTHVVHIRLATAVIFVLSGPPVHGQPSQVALAEITRGVCDDRPQVIVACCDARELGPIEESFPAIVQVSSFAPSDLQAAADVIFGETKKQPPSTGPNLQNLILAPNAWTVDVWNGPRDMDASYELWCQCFPEKFHMSRFLFQSLLQRDGYVRHYVVREPGTSQLLGFCATYTTYAGAEDERLVGSMAALVVRPAYRKRGIGLSLHNHALKQLTKTRGVWRLQLGSTFPRLFYGLPMDSPAEDWFRRRNWSIDAQEATDWLLKFDNWPTTGLLPSGLVFRPCEFHEFDMVLALVGAESKRRNNVGWYDQYAKLANSMNIQDIVIGLNEGGSIVAAALTYVKNTGSPAAEDLPWANTIADDVGGVTCICIAGQYHHLSEGHVLMGNNTESEDADELFKVSTQRDAVMIGLLDSCIQLLSNQGMKQLFIDAVKGGDEGFQSMGFQKWARYRDVWRDI